MSNYYERGLGTELYIQDKVLVKSVEPPCYGVEFNHNLGTLSVTEYRDPPEKFIEWRQSELTVETEEQDEWAVVQEATNGRVRTRSGCIGLGPPVIQLKLGDLKSFRVSRDNHKVTLDQNDGVTRCCFFFQKGADFFVTYLKSILQTTQCRRNPKLHLIMNQPDVQNLNKSFAQLELFPESKSDVIWTFMQKFHNRPLETTMDAFSKVTDVLLYKPIDEHEIAERLSSSLQADDLTSRGEEYEVVAQKVALPPRILPPRTLPLTRSQWENFFEPDGSIQEHEIVKDMIFHGGVDPSIRKQVWQFLLNFYPWNSNYEERENLRKIKTQDYNRMKLQWKSMSKEQEDRFSDYKERKSLIEKDVARTDRTVPYFADENNPHLEQLQDILMTYVMYNFDLGYVQGMSDLLSPLLMLIRDEVDTFWCFTSMIERMVRNFDVDQAGMKEQLQQLYQLLAIAEPELANHLVRQESNNMFFCFRWLLVWFKREFSFEDIYILWETLWAEARCPNYHLLLCLAILDSEKETLISNEYGFTEILKHINDLSGNIDLDLTLRKAEGIYLQLSSSDLPNYARAILGMTPIPEENQKNGSNDEIDEIDGEKTPMSSSQMAGITYSVDTEEVAFENAIGLQFL